MICESHPFRIRSVRADGFCVSLLVVVMLLSGCGSSGSPNNNQLVPPNLSGNWQFTLSPPTDGSFVGGLQGGSLVQNGSSITGATNYAVSLTSFSIPCNQGSATITGTVSGQTVALSAVAGTQTFTFMGTLSLDGSTMTGNYNATAGQAGDGSPCGAAETGLQWTAILVPPLIGPIQGTFQSGGGAAGLTNQNFAVSGSLSQVINSGSSSSTVTGNLIFESSYPCFNSATVYGQISGNSVSLEIVGTGGSEWGLIGEPVGSLGGTGLSPVTLESTQGGYALQAGGASYLIATENCPGALGDTLTSGDYGSICLALSGSACQQPVTLIPSGLTFSSQSMGGPPASETLLLANNSNSTLTGVTLSLVNESGATNFVETDNCGPGSVSSQGQPFNFYPGQSCTVKVTFAPVETCAVGTPQGQCPSPLTAKLVVGIANGSMIITAPITGTATAADAASSAHVQSQPIACSQDTSDQSHSVLRPSLTLVLHDPFVQQFDIAGC